MYQRNMERNQKILQMLEDGYSVNEIAQEFSLTRQAINAIKNRSKPHAESDIMDGRVYRGLNSIVYPRIKEFLYENKLSVIDFCHKINEAATPRGALYRFLKGNTPNISIKIIYKVLEFTQMSFEEAFRKD